MIRALKDGKNEGVAATTKSAGSSRLWLGLRDPRIVRVSRAAGGKDRHSKVCTVKGLRDRRVRLSVQTAIELYDLQDKLGLNQPSKVVDWLLTAAQQEIDKLPPLQFPPHFFPSSSGTVAPPPPPAPPPGSDRCDVGPDMQYHQLDGANQGDCSMGGYLSQLFLCPPGRLVQQPLMIQSLANYPVNSAFHVVDGGGGLLKASDYFSRAKQQ